MKICERPDRRLRLLRAVGLGAVLFALSTIVEKASAFTLLQYDFSQSGYISGSSEGTLTGNFTGEVDPDGLVTSVSTLTFQFQRANGVGGNHLAYQWIFGALLLLLRPDVEHARARSRSEPRQRRPCLHQYRLGRLQRPFRRLFHFEHAAWTFRTVNQPVLTFDQGIFGVTDPPPPIEPPPILAVPEASTWSLMALGFAAFGFAHWRRKPKLQTLRIFLRAKEPTA